MIHLLNQRSPKVVNNPISLGMEPVSSLSSVLLKSRNENNGTDVRNGSTLNRNKVTDIVDGRIPFMIHLHNWSDVRDVSNPISLGMVPER